ncbi:sgt2 [[Candida] subhashii]|uniref:Sgt2 n=1 Tax=[Candida] subhashii TaxID=561895 RepID=A0A8J5Q8L3_9ASCO|nr:sgt2 [[Candida] subhashii]KAG7662894.1 sgt2 [[Candida] subhashii]
MTVSNKDIALNIINYLTTSIKNKQINEEYVESLDVAIDCIADAFEVNKEDAESTIKDKFQGKSLDQLLNTIITSSSSATSTKESEVDAETRAKADALKVEGNRAMAAKNFSVAIAKYTEAIELDSNNVVYLSNRAAAYSSSGDHAKAVEDAEKAIELNPNFAKAYSRLGLAKYALGDAKSSMEAYKQGLDIEGETKSEAMRKGYETAKKRVEDELETTLSSNDTRSADSSSAGAGAGSAGGLPDFGSMFGGAGAGAGGPGGMPSFADMMGNPQIMQAAQEMMSNPNAMADLFNNPAVRQMAQSMGIGGEDGPDLSNIMNNPMLRNFMGGNNPGGNDNDNNNNA